VEPSDPVQKSIFSHRFDHPESKTEESVVLSPENMLTLTSGSALEKPYPSSDPETAPVIAT
jgi:hypothetical protein